MWHPEAAGSHASAWSRGPAVGRFSRPGAFRRLRKKRTRAPQGRNLRQRPCAQPVLQVSAPCGPARELDVLASRQTLRQTAGERVAFVRPAQELTPCARSRPTLRRGHLQNWLPTPPKSQKPCVGARHPAPPHDLAGLRGVTLALTCGSQAAASSRPLVPASHMAKRGRLARAHRRREATAPCVVHCAPSCTSVAGTHSTIAYNSLEILAQTRRRLSRACDPAASHFHSTR